jgi:hypothetical protein
VQTLHEIQDNFIGACNIAAPLPMLAAEVEINVEHRLARESAETAMQHAVRCGHLLAEHKAKLEHGEFGKWIEEHCEFSHATANNYMRAAKNPNALVISIRHLFPSGRKVVEPQEIHNDNGQRETLPTVAEAFGFGMTASMAIEILEPIPSRRQTVSRYRAWHREVGKLRNKLHKAEREFAEAERTLLQAGIEERAKSS